MAISSVEMARFYEKQETLSREIKNLKDAIQNNIETRERLGGELNDFYIQEYKKLLELPLNNIDDLEHVSWLFNYGNLRTDNEKYVHSGRFKADCIRRNYGVPITMFLIGFLPIIIPFIKEFYTPYTNSWLIGAFLGFFPAAIVGLLLGLIGSIISHSINASVAKNMNTSESIKIAREEALKRNISIGATVAAVTHTAYKAKGAVKDVANVDGWKEMK